MNRYDVINTSVEYQLTDFDILNQKMATPNVVDALCVDTYTDSNGNVCAVSLQSDISLLFNQKRLEDTLGRDGLKKFFDDMSARSTPLSELRSKISDDDLAALCKSRYLQSASEILSWSKYLNDNYQSLMESVKSRAAVQAASVEPAVVDPAAVEPSAGDGSSAS